MKCNFFFFKQKTAYEMRISDWSSDVCSSDLRTKAGDKICLNREGGKQGLAETMDRLDAEAAAAGVENAGKKGAGAFLRFRPMILAQSHQVHGERGAVHLHPCSQAVMDAFRHFRGARFREGEPEDIFRAARSE